MLSHIVPQNDKQPLVEVKIDPPRGIEYPVTDGVYARQEVTANIEQAVRLLEEGNPDKIITLVVIALYPKLNSSRMWV